MKTYTILLCLAMVGCAVGSQSEPESFSEVVDSGTRAPLPSKSPPSVQDAGSETSDAHSDCQVHDEWIDDCEVTTVVCSGTVKSVEVKCMNSQFQFPWQNLPDPPPPWVDTNVGRRNSHSSSQR